MPDLAQPQLPLTIGPRAAARLSVLLAKEAGGALRVSVEGGGCSGFQYKFQIDSNAALDAPINAYCGMRFLWYGLRGKQGVREPVHPDHVAYYSFSTLSVLLSRYALTVDSFLFYDIGREHRPHNKWYMNAANDVFTSIAPQWADGVVAVCRLSE